MCLDVDDSLWIADSGGHQVIRIDAHGQLLDTIECGDYTAYALALGGEDNRFLPVHGAKVRHLRPPGRATRAALNNVYAEDLIFLMLWPKIVPGANDVYDARRAAWGTSFLKKATAHARSKHLTPVQGRR